MGAAKRFKKKLGGWESMKGPRGRLAKRNLEKAKLWVVD